MRKHRKESDPGEALENNDGEKIMNVFQKIIKKEASAEIVYEDDLCMAFKDIYPQAPVHLLLIPKKDISSMEQVQEEDKELLGHLLLKASQIAKEQNLKFYRLVVNTNSGAAQTVFHLHIHILSGRALKPSFA